MKTSFSGLTSPISVNKFEFCKVCSQAEPRMAKTAAFHGRISAGIYAYTELGVGGDCMDAGGRATQEQLPTIEHKS